MEDLLSQLWLWHHQTVVLITRTINNNTTEPLCHLQTKGFQYVDFAYRAAAMFNQPRVNARLMKDMPTIQWEHFLVYDTHRNAGSAQKCGVNLQTVSTPLCLVQGAVNAPKQK